MIKVLNQYVPRRLFILLVSENVLILMIWATVAIQLGTWDPVDPIWLIKALLVTAICQLCLYYADIYDLRSLGSKTEVFFRLLEALGVATMLLAVLLLLFPEIGLDER